MIPKSLLSLCVAALLGGFAAQAVDYELPYLVFALKDGTTKACHVDGLAFNVTNGRLTSINAKAETLDLDVTNLEKMFFSSSTNAVDVIEASEEPAEVFTLAGVPLGNAAVRDLPPGTYIIKQGKQTYKIAVQ